MSKSIDNLVIDLSVNNIMVFNNIENIIFILKIIITITLLLLLS